jgi:hypothetical protein
MLYNILERDDADTPIADSYDFMRRTLLGEGKRMRVDR